MDLPVRRAVNDGQECPSYSLGSVRKLVAGCLRDTKVAKLGAEHPDTLQTLNNLALAYSAAGRTAEAIELYEQVRDATVAQLGAEHPGTLTTQYDLDSAYIGAAGI